MVELALEVAIHPVLSGNPAAVSLCAANGSALSVLGLVRFPVKLGDVTCDIDALVVPSLDLDVLLLDNDRTSDSGAVLNWLSRTLSLADGVIAIPLSTALATLIRLPVLRCC